MSNSLERKIVKNILQGVEGGGWERPLEEKIDLEKQESGENSGFKMIIESG